MRNLFGPLRPALACALLLGLTACASAPSQNLDAEHRAGIKTIFLLRVPEPAGMVASSDALSDGLVGAVIQASVNGSHEDQFNAAVREHQTPFAATLRDAVGSSLEGAGYKVEYQGGRSPRPNDDGTNSSYSTVQADTDAILGVRFVNIGYQDFGSRFYDPTVTVVAVMFEPRTHKQIYNRLFVAGYDKGIRNSVYLPIDHFKHYYLFSTMLKEYDFASTQLLQGVREIGAAIGQDLSADRTAR